MARAWAMKEAFRRLSDYRSIPAARGLLRALAGVGDLLAAPANNPFRRDHPASSQQCPQLHRLPTHECGHGGTERQDPWIKYSSRGFRNRERFKLAIYFHCGGLNLAP